MTTNTNMEDTRNILNLLKANEKEVARAVEAQMQFECDLLKQRCEFILQNEQMRASIMLREAHRERQEKISALQSQLECKNLAGLMYVMCSERRKGKLAVLRVEEEYTNYIMAMREMLIDAQNIILSLSRGYKTAARVDNEWKTKMKRVIEEFQCFINDFTGGTPEVNQYFFDLPNLLATEASVEDNPNEDPCESDEGKSQKELYFDDINEETEEREKPWYERMGDKDRPFMMYGDMAEFKAPERREVLTRVKAAKSAPKRWKQYCFHDMFVHAECSNTDIIKDIHPFQEPEEKWECLGLNKGTADSKISIAMSRRGTGISEDIRGNMGNMGSILKIVAAYQPTKLDTKTIILGARDSMEIASSTKVSNRHTIEGKLNFVQPKERLQIGSRRTSAFLMDAIEDDADTKSIKTSVNTFQDTLTKNNESVPEMDEDETAEILSNHRKVTSTDSKEVIPNHKKDIDPKIHYEKVCPMEECQRLKANSFMRSLPAYMQANPFTHFEQTFDQYETCTPEQLDILKQRLQAKALKADKVLEEPLKEWTPSVEGVAVQTSEISTSLPPCTCRNPFNSPATSNGAIFNLSDLFPMKQKLDTIKKEYLFDNNIQFNRFEVLGQETDSNSNVKPNIIKHKKRFEEVTKVLKEYPSFLEIFQANAQ